MPRARFVYTNQPVYLTLGPSVLEALSFGLLRPRLRHYRLTFASKGCDNSEVPLDPSAFLSNDAHYPDHEASVAQIGDTQHPNPDLGPTTQRPLNFLTPALSSQLSALSSHLSPLTSHLSPLSLILHSPP